jgi:hypothetical protein
MEARRILTKTMAESLMTADDLLRLPLPRKQTELIRGRVVVREPPGT